MCDRLHQRRCSQPKNYLKKRKLKKRKLKKSKGSIEALVFAARVDRIDAFMRPYLDALA